MTFVRRPLLNTDLLLLVYFLWITQYLLFAFFLCTFSPTTRLCCLLRSGLYLFKLMEWLFEMVNYASLFIDNTETLNCDEILCYQSLMGTLFFNCFCFVWDLAKLIQQRLRIFMFLLGDGVFFAGWKDN